MVSLPICMVSVMVTIVIGARVVSMPHCPHPECVCTSTDGTKTYRKQTAICNQMPKTALADSISRIKVTTPLDKVTQSMMAAVGPHVESVDLSNCEIIKLETGAFANQTGIVTLRLSNNLLHELPKQIFVTQSHVKYLYLDGNKLKALNENVLARLVNLQKLYLQRNQLKEVPSHLPHNLKHLDLSDNNIMSLDQEVFQSSLKVLDLCGNNFNELPLNESVVNPSLTTLCLGGQAVGLPAHASLTLSALRNLSLIARPDATAKLNSTTQTALAQMSGLEQLSLVHYKVDSLIFLHNLTELKVLKLQFITVDQLGSNELTLGTTHLEELILGGSPDLVQTVMGSPESQDNLDRLCQLNYLDLSNTNLQHPPPDLVPHKSFFHLDLSNNPLNCTCELVNLYGFLMQINRTLCDKRPVKSFVKESWCTMSEDVATSTLETLSNLGGHTTEELDNGYTTLYIILGSILATLVAVGIVLSLIYTKFKRSNQIIPGDKMQPEQSLQQLQQASSEDMLIKK